MAWYFLFFLTSGFCGILYELVWQRLAMARFGFTTPLVSIVLSMFMAGLGLGSWIAGTLIRRYEGRSNIPPLRLYALCEFLIGAYALMAPLQMVWSAPSPVPSCRCFSSKPSAFTALCLHPGGATASRIYGS